MSTSKLAPAIATEAAPRGLHGQLRVRAERLGDRTRLVEVDPRPPLQVMAAHEVEPRVPDLASLTVVSPSGGILQGDRLEVDIDVGMRARLAVGTQSSVRVYRAPEVGACSRTTLPSVATTVWSVTMRTARATTASAS